MKALPHCQFTAFLLCGMTASAQITIELADLQFEAGAQRSYLTHQIDVAIVSGLIKGAGGPHEWDFSTGPAEEAYCYQMMRAEESPFSGPFDGAGLAQLLTVDSDGATGWTFYSLTAAGRELHGFHDTIGNPSFPVTRFDLPVVDYPASIRYLDQWSVQSSYPSDLDLGGIVVPVEVEVTITSTVDAFGTLTLPTLGTVEVVRVNELSSFDSFADVGGTPLPLGLSYVRSHIWLAKEYGIVVQITSEGGTEVPPAEFDVASRLLRLSASIPPPDPGETPLIQSISYDPASAAVTIYWRAIVGRTYAVEVSDDLENWQPLGVPVVSIGTEEFFCDALIPLNTTERYYRVRRLD